VHADLRLENERVCQFVFQRSEAAFERSGAGCKWYGASQWWVAIWNRVAVKAYAIHADPGFFLVIIVFKPIAR